jgi:hypothetical protein
MNAPLGIKVLAPAHPTGNPKRETPSVQTDNVVIIELTLAVYRDLNRAPYAGPR